MKFEKMEALIKQIESAGKDARPLRRLVMQRRTALMTEEIRVNNRVLQVTREMLNRVIDL